MRDHSLEASRLRFRARVLAYLRRYRRRHPGWGLLRGYPSAEDSRRVEDLIQRTGWEHLRRKE